MNPGTLLRLLLAAFFLAGSARGVPDTTALKQAEWEKACADGDLEGCHHLAHLQEQRGNVKIAMALYQPNCEKGHVQSCHNLGVLAMERKKRAEAEGWFERACNQGFVDSCTNLAYLKECDGQIPEAMAQYRSACEKGSHTACRDSNTLQEHLSYRGEPTVRRMSEHDGGASDGLKKECFRGDNVACNAMGWFKREREPKVAAAYFKLACDRGLPYGCLGMVTLYPKEKFVGARKEYGEKACRKGLGFACLVNAHSLEFREHRMAEAVGYYELGCAAKEAVACAHLELLQKKTDAAQNLKTLYAEQCAASRADSCNWLGFFEHSEGRPGAAKSAYQKACALGDATGCQRVRDFEEHPELTEEVRGVIRWYLFGVLGCIIFLTVQRQMARKRALAAKEFVAAPAPPVTAAPSKLPWKLLEEEPDDRPPRKKVS